MFGHGGRYGPTVLPPGAPAPPAGTQIPNPDPTRPATNFVGEIPMAPPTPARRVYVTPVNNGQHEIRFEVPANGMRPTVLFP